MVIEELTKHIKYNGNDIRVKIVNALLKEEEKKKWNAGEQLSALNYYLREGGNVAKVIADACSGDYSGEFMAVILCSNKYWLWRDSYGSCSGCDAINGNNLEEGYDYIINTMTGVKEFPNIRELITYMENPGDVLYSEKRCIQEILLELLYVEKDDMKKYEDLKWKQVWKIFN